MNPYLPTRLFVHATNVHTGGGQSLLHPILTEVPGDLEVIAQLDARMKTPDKLSQKMTIRRVQPSILQRLRAEWWLAKHSMPNDLILCFGNLPPLFKLLGWTAVFVQNRYLVDDVGLNNFPLKTRLRLEVERLWLSRKMMNVDEFIVQTPSMKSLLEARTKGRVSVHVLAFMANHDEYVRRWRQPDMQKEKEFDFLYVASGETHKNHRQLIEAWCLLAEDGVFPSLKLTIDRLHFAELCSWIEQKIEQHRLHVKNLGSLPHVQIKQFYNQAGALIYPSTFESFGLPLIEARQAGLPVLASELDYVRDILDPEQTFDPESAVSIAKAVKRFMGMEDRPLALQDASGFMKHILDGNQ